MDGICYVLEQTITKSKYIKNISFLKKQVHILAQIRVKVVEVGVAVEVESLDVAAISKDKDINLLDLLDCHYVLVQVADEPNYGQTRSYLVRGPVFYHVVVSYAVVKVEQVNRVFCRCHYRLSTFCMAVPEFVRV